MIKYNLQLILQQHCPPQNLLLRADICLRISSFGFLHGVFQTPIIFPRYFTQTMIVQHSSRLSVMDFNIYHAQRGLQDLRCVQEFLRTLPTLILDIYS